MKRIALAILVALFATAPIAAVSVDDLTPAAKKTPPK